MSDIRKLAETFLACHDAFLLRQAPATAYAMKDAADALRRALAAPSEPYEKWPSVMVNGGIAVPLKANCRCGGGVAGYTIGGVVHLSAGACLVLPAASMAEIERLIDGLEEAWVDQVAWAEQRTALLRAILTALNRGAASPEPEGERAQTRCGCICHDAEHGCNAPENDHGKCCPPASPPSPAPRQIQRPEGQEEAMHDGARESRATPPAPSPAPEPCAHCGHTKHLGMVCGVWVTWPSTKTTSGTESGACGCRAPAPSSPAPGKGEP